MTELDSTAISSPDATVCGLMAGVTFGISIRASGFKRSSGAAATRVRKVNIRVGDDAATAVC